ncbi:hypothetical protein [Nocardioides marmoriginsengisoli]|uniref:LexA family protein n=1 Tax=Nocardioides marmoriginsengisoli TaxID=661483 RepID=UPI00161A74B8|nr:hypothetical protein [Nocardioides marmoriginsengisoli]
MTDPLTARQAQILEFLRTFITTNGYPPSLRQVCAGVGLKSTATVSRQLFELQAKGHIHREPTQPRALVVLAPDEQPAPDRPVPPRPLCVVPDDTSTVPPAPRTLATNPEGDPA